MITDYVSAYVYLGTRGMSHGSTADRQPRLKHKGNLGDLFLTGVQQKLFMYKWV